MKAISGKTLKISYLAIAEGIRSTIDLLEKISEQTRDNSDAMCRIRNLLKTAQKMAYDEVKKK